MKKPEENNHIEVFNNMIQTLCLLIDTNVLWAELGRGTGKSTIVMGSRTVRVAADMPQSTLILGGATYVSLMQNVVPAVLSYWNTYYVEGIHFVVGKKPPEHWKRPIVPIYDYKHTISTVWGNVFRLVSVDRPESSAGISAAHAFFDELKHIDSEKLYTRVFPTLRSDRLRFGKSPYFLGITGTSDTARIDLGDDNWFFEMEKNVDWNKITDIINIALHINKAKYDILNKREVEKNNRIIKKWIPRLNQLRSNSTFYAKGSAFYNKDILGLKYFTDMRQTLPWEDFKSSILNIRPSEVANKFFITFSDKNIISEIYNYRKIDEIQLGTQFHTKASDLIQYNPNLPLYTGTDFGNMTSLIVGQEYGGKFYILKNFHALNYKSQYIAYIVHQFNQFFAGHKNKQIYAYYDRAGNNYGSRSDANYLKNEFNAAGWHITLKSEGQKTIEHGEYYDLFEIIFSEKISNNIKIRILENECKELISSIRLSPTKYSAGKIVLDKSSEKLKQEDLPMRSTNYATALWYLIYGLYSKLIPNDNKMRDLRI